MAANENEQAFLDMRERIAARFAGMGVDEASNEALAPPRVPERLAQAIWFEGMFRAEFMRTVSGKSLAIEAPGRWNKSAGPDFLQAEIVLDGKKLKGDVEVHVAAGDWRRHGHERDFAYNPVVLHVCLDSDDGARFDEKHNGERLERLELRPILFPDLDSIRETLSAEDFPYEIETGLGRCHEYFVEEDEALVRRFLETGGRMRMESKIRRLSDQLDGAGYGQLFYQALMSAMGLKGTKALFFLLSKRAPIDELLDYSSEFEGQERAERIEAALLHVAGLAPRGDSEPAAEYDSETMAYLNRVNAHWAEISGYFSDRLISPTRRWHSGTRPANFPERRMAGVAHFVIRNARGCGFFEEYMERLGAMRPKESDPRSLKTYLKMLEASLMVDAPGDYWARRYTLQAKPASRPMSLIGASQARSIIFNSLLPMTILHARGKNDLEQERFLWRLHDRFPPLESNNIVRFMRQRLFGEHPRGKSLLLAEPTLQGLFQVFQSCCGNRERDCDTCFFLRDGRARSI